jgi:septal ring factor EnvC (AmiA/AmiB activator)
MVYLARVVAFAYFRVWYFRVRPFLLTKKFLNLYSYSVFSFCLLCVPLSTAQDLEAQVDLLKDQIAYNQQQDLRRDKEIQEIRQKQSKLNEQIADAYMDMALSKQVRNVEYGVMAITVGLFAWALRRLDYHTTKLARLAQVVEQHESNLMNMGVTLKEVHAKVNKIEAGIDKVSSVVSGRSKRGLDQ